MTPLGLTQVKSSGPGTGPPNVKSGKQSEIFSRFARFISSQTGHPLTFVAAMAAVVIWALIGPVSHFSETWQLWINTSTTILTFLMVFLLQNAQMRDTRAVHLKIDELIRAVEGARNEMIDLENLSEEELEKYAAEFRKLHLRYASALTERSKRLLRTET
jgi:low affinity Fe/Cu permease